MKRAAKKSLEGTFCDVLGIGISNRPLIRLLRSLGAEVSAYDKKTREAFGGEAEELESLGVRVFCEAFPPRPSWGRYPLPLSRDPSRPSLYPRSPCPRCNPLFGDGALLPNLPRPYLWDHRKRRKDHHDNPDPPLPCRRARKKKERKSLCRRKYRSTSSAFSPRHDRR